jgi:hypothetical protein
MGAMSCARLADVSQLLAEHSSKCSLQRLVFSFYMLPQRAVDEALIISTACGVYLAFEPRQQIIAKTDGDPGLAAGRGNDRQQLPAIDLLALVSECGYTRYGRPTLERDDSGYEGSATRTHRCRLVAPSCRLSGEQQAGLPAGRSRT